MPLSNNSAFLEAILNIREDVSNTEKMENKRLSLQKIYGHAPTVLIVDEVTQLPSIENFNTCKKEMLQLLDYIINLGEDGSSKNRFAIFSQLKSNITNSLEYNNLYYSKPEDIRVILFNTKTTIENALINIEQFARTSKIQIHDNYNVSSCFQGANSNIENLIGDYFTDKSLINNVLVARKKVIHQLANEFVDEQGLAEGYYRGNHLHVANFFYNQFAKDYNLAEIIDEETIGYEEQYKYSIPAAKRYIERRLSLNTILDTVLAEHPLPDLESVNNPDAWKQIEERKELIGAFFSVYQSIHHADSDEDFFYYAKFYDEHSEFDDDELPADANESDKGTWIRPKKNIMDYYQCYLIQQLIKEDLIPEASYFKTGIVYNEKQLSLLYNGHAWFVVMPAIFDHNNRVLASAYYRPLTSFELENSAIQEVIFDSLSSTDELIDYIRFYPPSEATWLKLVTKFSSLITSGEDIVKIVRVFPKQYQEYIKFQITPKLESLIQEANDLDAVISFIEVDFLLSETQRVEVSKKLIALTSNRIEFKTILKKIPSERWQDIYNIFGEKKISTFISVYWDLSYIINALSSETYSTFFDTFGKLVWSACSNIEKFNSYSSCLNQKACMVLWSANKEPISQLIKTPQDLKQAVLDFEYKKLLAFNRFFENEFSSIYTQMIQKADDLDSIVFLLKINGLLNEEQRQNLAKKINSFTKNSSTFKNILRELPSEQWQDFRTMLGENVHQFFKKDSLSDLFGYWILSEGPAIFNVFAPEILPKLANINDFNQLSKSLSENACVALWSAYSEHILKMIETPLDLKNATKGFEEKINAFNQIFDNKITLKKLLKKIEVMREYGESLKTADPVLSENVISFTAVLIESANKLYDKPPEYFTKENLLQANKEFNALLLSKDGMMHNHRAIWKPIVANVLIALSGFGLIAIGIKASVNAIKSVIEDKPITFNNTFFFAKTNRQKAQENIEKIVDNFIKK